MDSAALSQKALAPVVVPLHPQGRSILVKLGGLLTIQGSKLVIVPAVHPVRLAPAKRAVTVNIPLVEAVALVRTLPNPFSTTFSSVSRHSVKLGRAFG